MYIPENLISRRVLGKDRTEPCEFRRQYQERKAKKL
jgi:hypothetical protein